MQLWTIDMKGALRFPDDIHGGDQVQKSRPKDFLGCKQQPFRWLFGKILAAAGYTVWPVGKEKRRPTADGRQLSATINYSAWTWIGEYEQK